MPVTLPPATPHKIYLVDKTHTIADVSQYGNIVAGDVRELSYSPKIMLEFQKTCPSVTFTQEKSAADFTLNAQNGGSSLTAPNGDVVYTSPAKTLRNMVKDVCRFIGK